VSSPVDSEIPEWFWGGSGQPEEIRAVGYGTEGDSGVLDDITGW